MAGVEADIGLIFVGSFLRAGVVKPPWELALEDALPAFLVVPPKSFFGLLDDGDALFNWFSSSIFSWRVMFLIVLMLGVLFNDPFIVKDFMDFPGDFEYAEFLAMDWDPPKPPP